VSQELTLFLWCVWSMKDNEQHEKMTTTLVELRERLCSGHSITEDGAMQGRVLFFNPEQQQYGVLWTVKSEVQNPLEYVGLERLLGLLVNADMKEIVSTLMDFEKNRVSPAGTGEHTGQKSKEMLETEAAAAGAADQSMHYPATR